MSDLDAYREAAYLPEGPTPGADLQMIRPGVILDRDIPGRRLRVSYNGGDGTWINALPNRYVPGTTCFVLCNPLAGGRAEVVLSQISGSENALKGAATLVSLGAETAVVEFEGGVYTVDFMPNAYGPAGSQVWVLLSPSLWGAPELLLGPTEFVTPVTPPPPPPVPPSPGPATVQVRTTIGPTWSGTWRASRGAWDRWNTSQFGGRSDLYQGDGYGSGPLVGLATYGDQLRNLGAISIDAINVSLIHNGGTGMSGPPILQGAANGSQPGGGPSTFGGTFGSEVPAGTREDLRTGAAKGIALVGGGYYAVRGTSHPAGMALDVWYTRSA